MCVDEVRAGEDGGGRGGPGPTAGTRPSMLRRHASAFLDLLYPRRCELCEVPLPAGRPGAGRWLCDPCDRGLPRVRPPFCRVCGEPAEAPMTEGYRCGNCADLALHFEFSVAACRAEEGVRLLVHRFKYQHRLDLRGLLGTLLLEVFRDPRLALPDLADWVLVPVPLHHARERERQYNQAWELCRELARRTGIEPLQALRRVRATPPQASLTRRRRIENLRGAFAVGGAARGGRGLEGRKVLLVDDVLTTGSTTSECARVLGGAAGVEKVVVITLARG